MYSINALTNNSIALQKGKAKEQLLQMNNNFHVYKHNLQLYNNVDKITFYSLRCRLIKKSWKIKKRKNEIMYTKVRAISLCAGGYWMVVYPLLFRVFFWNSFVLFHTFLSPASRFCYQKQGKREWRRLKWI